MVPPKRPQPTRPSLSRCSAGLSSAPQQPPSPAHLPHKVAADQRGHEGSKYGQRRGGGALTALQRQQHDLGRMPPRCLEHRRAVLVGQLRMQVRPAAGGTAGMYGVSGW